MRIRLAILIAWLAVAPAVAQRKKAAAPPPPDPLQQRIEAVLASPDAWRAYWGIKIVSLDTGKTLYSHNEHQLFTPASNTKLFTTALALATLGPQFRFRTTLESGVAPDKYGRVAGDLWLVGRGDPNLSGRALPYKGKTERDGPPLRALDALADQLVSRGVHYVDGDLIADDTYFVFERYGEGWAQDDLVLGYGAPVSALSVNDNVLFLQVLPGEKPGDRALLKFDPPEPYYKLENRVRTVEAGAAPAAGAGGAAAAPQSGTRRIFINREPGGNRLEVWGAIPADDKGLTEQVAIEDPAAFAAEYLRATLAQRGIVVYGQARVRHAHPYEYEDLKAAQVGGPPAQARRTVLAAYESLPLADDLKVIDKVSQNLHAEMLLRTVARERRGIGSVAAGLEELKAFLERAGVPESEHAFFDGSGLSRQNLVSPAAILALLQYMDAQPFREIWRDLLPVAGVDGSLSERMKETAAAGRVLAKTGSLGHVNALSGYGTTPKGERVAFSILVNNHNMRGRQVTALLDRICLAIME
jgi:D-alanyl-D-alanine carboxypeptidase/D-alanyl-D-alanine-endopeptidase (penicillin-binding protein 4)